MVVGITGGIGSGKSTVAHLFKKFDNVVIYTADEEAKKLINTSLTIIEKIKKHFGEKAYDNGELNRNYLSIQVFNNKDKLDQLNAIVHLEVRTHFLKFSETHKDKLILYENAILFEIGNDRFCDFVITVCTEIDERIYRVMKRDGVSKKEVLARIKNQWRDEKKIMLSNYMIANNYKNSLTLQVDKIHNILTKKQS
ncbi:MAG: dephospho-CoA kinase [Flavobacteriaceae bacterium]|nr:MAG: dephospho-CoA kinase [Flavobacteriaceae bacterium]